MFREFEDYIKQHTVLSAKEIELIRSVAIEKTLRRKDFLLQQGEVCHHKVFVSKGLLRTYSTREQGSEHIMRFSAENSWTTDPESLEMGTPSSVSIDAIENSEVVSWTKDDMHYLIDKIPGLKSYFNKLVARSGNVLRQRVINTISLSAEEKYEDFVKNYPEINARVPLHMVASYLGVTRETLSRIRRAQVTNK